MSEVQLTDWLPREPKGLREGQCPKCGADKDKVRPTFGGGRVCMGCGHMEQSNGQ